MASAYSILHNYQQELYTPNLELIGTALAAKQQTLNANRQKLQTMRDQFTFLDVAKEEDQEHLEGRLQATMGVIDKYSHLDLSSNNLTNQLIAAMDNVIDEDVTTAVISTRRYNAEEAEWAKKREEGEKYSDSNYQYARQGARKWLSDGQKGTRYNGGGGFIEYSDVEGKLSKAMPDAAKQLGYEYKELSDGGGYFRDVITKKRVEREKLEQVMNGLLNEKDRKQLQINAWANYDGMTDEQLQSNYDGFYAPIIEGLESKVQSLTDLVSSTSNPSQRAVYEQSLDNHKEKLESYKNNSYENFSEKYGREGAYNTLYNAQFKENYLAPYEMDAIVGIATYDNDVKTRNYELALAKFAETKENNTKIRPGDEGYVAPSVGDYVGLDYDEQNSKVKEVFENKRRIVDEVKGIFGIEDNGQLRELKGVIDRGYSNISEIEFNGRTIKLTPEVRASLLEYENNIINKSPGEAKALDEFTEGVNTTIRGMRQLAQGRDSNFDAQKEVPSYNFIFKEDESGVMRRVNFDGSKENRYATLLGKKDLTADEEYTLGAYYRIHLLSDPKLADDKKEVVLEELQTRHLNRLENTDFDRFPMDVKGYKAIQGKIAGSAGYILAGSSGTEINAMLEEGFFDEFKYLKPTNKNKSGWVDQAIIQNISGPKEYMEIVSEIVSAYGEREKSSGEKRQQAQQKIDKLKNEIRKTDILSTVPIGWTDKFPSDITNWDAAYTDEDGRRQDPDSPTKGMFRTIDLYYNTIEQEAKEQDKEASLNEQIFSENTSGYENLKPLIGLSGNSKIPVTIYRTWNKETREPTDEVNWRYTDSKGKIVSSATTGKKLSAAKLRENGVISFGQPSKSPYDAGWGKNAPKVNLGNGVYDEAIVAKNMKRNPNLSMNAANVTELIDEASDLGKDLVDEIRVEYEKFNSGEFNFKLEAMNDTWYFSMYDAKGNFLNKIETQEGGVKTYTVNEVVNMQEDGQYHVNNVMWDYLAKKVEDEAVSQGMTWEATQKRKVMTTNQ